MPSSPEAPRRTPKVSYGGQAVLEGVMMRGRRYMAVAVRAPDHSIVVTSQELPQQIYGGVIQKIPFVRGITLIWDSVGLGLKALMFAADVQARGEDGGSEEPAEGGLGAPLAWTTVAVALIFAVGIFFLTPLGLVAVAERLVGASNAVWSNVAEGIIRLVLLIGYVALIGRLPDIRRVYEYHGAEHMTIHAWEHDDPLDPDHVAQYSPAHPRCGTAFLLEVVAISIVLFGLLGTPEIWIRVASRVVLIPVIAGIAYELLRFGGKHPDSWFMKVIVAPGLALQALTTRYPDRSEMEVAIASMDELVKHEESGLLA